MTLRAGGISLERVTKPRAIVSTAGISGFGKGMKSGQRLPEPTSENAKAKPGPRRVQRAELIWEGKYDGNGKRNGPLRVALPFQTVETVNESTQDRQRSLFSPGFREEEWRNRLIWGDKKYVLPSLLSEFAGKVNLIYIDPPFDTGADFSFTATVPDNDDAENGSFAFSKDASIIEEKAYRDTWGRGLDSYLQWFYGTAVLLHELLHENGSIYVHIGWQVSAGARLIMDEVFGSENFLNEIVWQRSSAHNDARRFGIIHDTIILYSKTDRWTFNPVYSHYDEGYIKERFRYVEEKTGKRYWLNTMTAAGSGEPKKFRGKMLTPPRGTHWRYSQDKIDQMVKTGRIVFTDSGMPYVKQYFDESRGRAAQSIWTDVVPTKSGSELVGYPTQKPEALLDRIIRASSNEDDLL